MTSLLVLANDSAGSSDKLDEAVRLLERDASVDVATISSDDDLDRAIDGLEGRVAVIAGGDGTVHRVVERLHQRGELGAVELALIPLGTGNDFARGVGVPLRVADAVALVLGGSSTRLDLVVDDAGGVVVNNVHLGVGAEASRAGARWKKRIGRLGYGLGLVQASFHRSFRLDVEIDGELVADADRPVLEVSVGNGSTVGGGLPLNPGADPADGQLDVVVAFAAGPIRRIGYGLDLLRAAHPRRRDVLRRTVDVLRVSGEPFHLSADGEIGGPERSREWRVERAAMQFRLAPPTR